MSRVATDWAWSLEVKPATLKLILLSMADRADEEHCCFPSIQRLVKDTSLNEKTVQSGINKLIEMGFVSDTGERKGPTRRVRVLRLNVSQKQPQKRNDTKTGNITENGTLNDPEIGMLNDPEIGVQNQSLEPVIEPVISIDASAAADASHGSRAERKRVQQKTTAKPDVLFEQVWSRYPKRAGSNPKNKAQSAWNARKKLGVSPAVMANGLDRYIAFCEATGRVGTEFVMQAARFFGPSHEFENDWTPAVEQQKPQGKQPPTGGAPNLPDFPFED
jgi:hypothetical protein